MGREGDEAAAVTLSGVVLGTAPQPETPRTDPLADAVPIVPTSARSFTGSETIVAFFRVFQGGSSAAANLTLRVRILDRRDQPAVDTTETIAPEAFADRRGVARHIPLPLSELTPGPYLLNIVATRPGGVTVRREVIFRVR